MGRKINLMVGIGVGYVLGARAGRGRYEQIKNQWLKLWHRDEVQAQVDKVKDFAGEAAKAIPGTIWDGAVSVSRKVSSRGEDLD